MTLQMALPNVDSTTLYQDDTIRLIMYIDKQCNGGPVITQDILLAQRIEDHYNMDTVDRFIILKDFKVRMVFPTTPVQQVYAAGNITVAGAVSIVRKMIKIKQMFPRPLPITYISNAGLLASINTNNLCMLGITKNGIILVDYWARIYFSDL